jgi:hydrogenase small subunit
MEEELMSKPDLFPGVNRRDFIKTCVTVSAMLGLPFGMVNKVAAAAQKADNRPAVIWLHFQECTGCSESLLRSSHPTVANLILDLVSLDYHETLMAGSGHQAEKSLHESMQANKGKYILVVEGGIPTKDNGIYCKVGGKTALESLRKAAEGAAAIISIGTCASYGGIQSVGPNPTGAVGVGEIIKDKPVINLPGCPPSPYNFLSTVLYYVTFKKLPELDKMGRPMFAYGRKIHEHCERRAHFDAGRFAQAFGDEGHSLGYCLYKLGCKGPETYANCPSILFGDVGNASWPVGTGHPCIGCTEKGIGFTKPIHALADLKNVVPPLGFPRIVEEQGSGATIASVAVVAAAAGAAVGAAAAMAKNLGQVTVPPPEKTEGKAETERAGS